MADDFPDGVWVIELAAVGDPAAVPEAVAAVLGITQQPGMSVTDSVAAALEGRSRLLVFDNCEHVLDAAADLIEAILAASDDGDRSSPPAAKDLRRRRRTTLAGAIAGGPKRARLHRRRAVRRPRCGGAGDVSLHATTPRWSEICRRLDGIPLAIELAASRLHSMTVIEVRDRLDDRFRLLVGSRRGLERHQTLRHAVQWSYDLLDDDEKALLARCSVFAGGFDLAGACAVAGSDDEFATLDLLDALVRKSLLVADRSSGRTRFSMLETIRQFAEEQLAAMRGGRRRPHRARPLLRRARRPMCSPCGTARGSARHTTGSRSNSQTCAPHSDGPPTTATSTPPPPSPLRAFLGNWVEQYEPIAGPRNSSNPRGQPNTGDWHSST